MLAEKSLGQMISASINLQCLEYYYITPSGLPFIFILTGKYTQWFSKLRTAGWSRQKLLELSSLIAFGLKLYHIENIPFHILAYILLERA
jgi:hypothetical protein